MQFSGIRRDLVDLHLIHAVIHCAQVLVVRSGDHTAHMRPEVTLGDRTDPLMEDTVHHRAQTSVLMRVHNGHLPVVIAAYKEELAGDVRRQIAASHAVNVDLIDGREPSVRLDLQHFHSLVSDGIQELAAPGLRDIGGIVNRYHIALGQCTVLRIDIIDMDPYTAAVGVSPDICDIFFLIHSNSSPSCIRRTCAISLRFSSASVSVTIPA